MKSLSTHVLDAVAGAPAAGVEVRVARSTGAGAWVDLATAVTDADGRVASVVPAGLQPGTYRLVFLTGPYFARTRTECFYPEVTVCFAVNDDRHYHVPLLLSPFAYSTYRGS